MASSNCNDFPTVLTGITAVFTIVLHKIQQFGFAWEINRCTQTITLQHLMSPSGPIGTSIPVVSRLLHLSISGRKY
jgi:hypothetical protein